MIEPNRKGTHTVASRSPASQRHGGSRQADPEKVPRHVFLELVEQHVLVEAIIPDEARIRQEFIRIIGQSQDSEQEDPRNDAQDRDQPEDTLLRQDVFGKALNGFLVLNEEPMDPQQKQRQERHENERESGRGDEVRKSKDRNKRDEEAGEEIDPVIFEKPRVVVPLEIQEQERDRRQP